MNENKTNINCEKKGNTKPSIKFEKWTFLIKNIIRDLIKIVKRGEFMKYLKLVDGLKSNANGFEYKIGEINVAEIWNPSTFDPALMGGFNFSTDDKILRWIHRGDTIYDVEIPTMQK